MSPLNTFYPLHIKLAKKLKSETKLPPFFSRIYSTNWYLYLQKWNKQSPPELDCRNFNKLERNRPSHASFYKRNRFR